MANQETGFSWGKFGQTALACAVGVGVVLGGAHVAFPDKPVVQPTQINVGELSDSIANKVSQQVNSDNALALSNLSQVTAETHAEVFKSDAWEASVELLANDEWGANNNKDLYNFLDDEYSDIHEKGDISSITVKNTHYSDMDADNHDGVVVQELVVRYENSDGDNVKRYVTVTTTVNDGDVDEQDFTETA